MEYKIFIRQVPGKTKKMIKKAIDIYKYISTKNIERTIYEKHENTMISLGKIDKKCISLFLAGMLTDSSINQIMLENDITSKKIFQYLKIEEKDMSKIDKPNISENDYERYFDRDFKMLLENMEKNMSSIFEKNQTQYMYPEYIMNCLAYPQICISDVIKQLYISLGCLEIGNMLSKHDTFLDLSEMFETKIIATIERNLEEEINEIISGKNEVVSEDKIKSIFKTEKEEQEERELASYILTKYGEIITDKKYDMNPAIGREKEIKELMLTLLTPDKSAIITGEPGVGKTAVVEGLAYLIKTKQVPKMLQKMEIVKMNTSALLSGCIYRGMFEERVEEILKEIEKCPNTILFIDEIHTVIGAGCSSDNELDFANILKPYLDRGQIKMIGATTNEEYEKYIQKDEAFKRRFEKIKVPEPDENIIAKILLGTIPKLETTTNIKFDYSEKEQKNIIDLIVSTTNRKSRTYNDNINNPDLALSILKKSFAHAALLEHKKVEIEDIAEAIRSSERISSLVRNRQARALLAQFQKQEEITQTAKIIQFPQR